MRGLELGVLIIPLYTRILEVIKPDFVHVLVDGKFVLDGGPAIADRLEKTGYSEWVKEDGAPKEVASWQPHSESTSGLITRRRTASSQPRTAASRRSRA